VLNNLFSSQTYEPPLQSMGKISKNPKLQKDKIIREPEDNNRVWLIQPNCQPADPWVAGRWEKVFSVWCGLACLFARFGIWCVILVPYIVYGIDQQHLVGTHYAESPFLDPYSHVWNPIYLYGVRVEGMHQSVFYYQWSIHVNRMELPCHVNHRLKFRPYISYIAFKYAKYLWFGYLNFPSSNGSDWKYRGPKFQLPVVFP
jgi:hypothetical protein